MAQEELQEVMKRIEALNKEQRSIQRAINEAKNELTYLIVNGEPDVMNALVRGASLSAITAATRKIYR